MYRNYKLDKYFLVDSVIHRINPVIKIISLFLICIGLFFINNISEILLITIHLLTSILWSNISIKVYLKKVYIFRYLLFFIFLFNIILSLNIFHNLLIIYRIILLIIYINILLVSTSQFEIIYGLKIIFYPISKIVNLNKIIYCFSLFIRFLDIYQEQSERIKISISLKGVVSKKAYFKNKINITKNCFIYSIKQLKSLDETIKLKLYDYNKSRNNYRYNKLTKSNILILIINISVIFILIRR